MIALITGITGFVGHHLQNRLIAEGAEVYGTSRQSNLYKHTYQLDLQEQDEIVSLLKKISPTHIFHLAGMSNVRDSWVNVSKTIEANTLGTINLLEAVKKLDKEIRVITIGSSEEYGKATLGIHDTISETTLLNPLSPYGTSKAAVSMLVKQYYKGFGLDVIHVRPFNHIGPGQKLGFVTSDFAHQIALINNNTNHNKIKVGNLESFRDFTDVRDIVRAYYMLALKGYAGEIYNVCSGISTSIQEILNILLSFSNKKIAIETDPNKMRPSDIPYFIGDYTKIKNLTKWEPKISIHHSLQDIYQYWLSV
ncbi:GDP-mannose 4,6-dehydratase [Bacillus sp. Xin]|uniref:GDP-mannose 4,6-dehydratase n=1 Tax=unclassified Bacillus (in: firmicutes) TaxID=185979 RepID=UPI0015725DCB|nr:MULTISPECIES: GDP-mannose 4,6-dehydratase [unclassified Bacillus (in: firmicutes)]MBC6975843.1 GDP-mannose 4,6-dehydratase [Bacillus sp. Xin]NSW35154.1 GDP-mannose 4,6-dehydratase [Bacillus sp. Xin1]